MEKNETETLKPQEFSPKFEETTGFLGKVQKGVHGVTAVLETLISILLIVGIILSFVKVPEKLSDVLSNGEAGLTSLIRYVATVIIVIEFIHVIIAQNLDSVIEILMLAFTRELVIREWQMWQLLCGVAVIAGLFAVKRFLVKKEKIKR